MGDMTRRHPTRLVLGLVLLAGAQLHCGDDEGNGFGDGSGLGSGNGFGTGSGGPSPDPSAGNGSMGPGGGNTNVNFGGAQDFGFVRGLLEAGEVPRAVDFIDSGFFAEHQTPLPEPICGERVCVQGMLGVMGNLIDGSPCTLLQVGLNSPIIINDQDVQPLDLAVVIDVSGSMQSGDKIGFVRDGLRQMVNELNDDDRIALIAYATESSFRVQPGPVQGRRNELFDAIDRLQAGGGTNLLAGLEDGFQSVLQGPEGYARRVILLSDGRPTAGVVSTQAILNVSLGYVSEGIGLTTIGLGTDFNQELMSRLAEGADGNHYFVENASAVDEVFEEELRYFTVAVAKDLQLDVAVDENFSVDQVYGSPSFQADGAGGRLEVGSVFLAHRRSPDDVTDGNGRRGGGSALLFELMARPSDGPEPATTEVARIEASFLDPELGERVSDELVVEYPFSPSTVLETGFFENDIVTKSFVMLNIFVGMQRAAAEFEAGRGEGAYGILIRLRAAVEDYNEEVQDTDIELDLELIDRMAANIETRIAPPPPPEIPENPWPAD